MNASQAVLQSVRRLALTATILCSQASLAGPAQDAAAYADAITKINEAHVRQPGRNTEANLAQQLPAAARSALKRLLEAKLEPEVLAALSRCAEAALDLDLVADFEVIRTRIATVAPEPAAKLGQVVSRPRFIVRGIGAFEGGYLDQFSDVSMRSSPLMMRCSASRNSQKSRARSCVFACTSRRRSRTRRTSLRNSPGIRKSIFPSLTQSSFPPRHRKDSFSFMDFVTSSVT
jgi:hypothetical protein